VRAGRGALVLFTGEARDRLTSHDFTAENQPEAMDAASTLAAQFYAGLSSAPVPPEDSGAKRAARLAAQLFSRGHEEHAGGEHEEAANTFTQGLALLVGAASRYPSLWLGLGYGIAVTHTHRGRVEDGAQVLDHLIAFGELTAQDQRVETLRAEVAALRQWAATGRVPPPPRRQLGVGCPHCGAAVPWDASTLERNSTIELWKIKHLTTETPVSFLRCDACGTKLPVTFDGAFLCCEAFVMETDMSKYPDPE
jgi:hypothetical protein